MKLFKLSVLFVLISNSITAQYSTNKDINYFSYLSIKNTLDEYPNDSIRFIITGAITEKKPVIIFCSGSGNSSIMRNDGVESYLSAFPQHVCDAYKSKYHIVIISKPGISFTTPDTIPFPFDMNAPEMFWKCDTKDYHVKSTALILKYLRGQNYIDTSRIYLVGHSQGAGVAIKVATNYPHLLTKVVHMSASIFGRHSQNIQALYSDIVKKNLSHEEFVSKTKKIYEYLKTEKNFYETDTIPKKFDLNYYIWLSNNSFNIDITANYLSKLIVPVLFVYGTADIKSFDCNLIPLILLNTDVNYTLIPFAGYEHNYFEIDEQDNPIYEKYHWLEVFDTIVKWLEL
jgi:pimeloyl-ACP methyl ester carboxylesterase